MKLTILSKRTLVAVALIAGLAVPPVHAAVTSGPAVGGVTLPSLATPQLIEADVASGRISRLQGDIELASALAQPARLSERYRSTAAWRGTAWLRALKQRHPSRSGPVGSILGFSLSTCSTSVSVTPAVILTDHFRVEYLPGTIRGLTAQDYADSLEAAWRTEVDDFGWAAPPITEPDGRYLVLVDPTLAPGLYGFVASEERVGDNPNTAWDDQSAYTSCMVLNADFQTFFPGTPQQALDATTAHEFHHSLQFGLGVLSRSGLRAPSNFVEGGASWVEDEVFDDSNDSYNFLWPDFSESMVATRDAYAYWIVWRGLTERFGTTQAGGAEQVMQEMWEAASRDNTPLVDGLTAALARRGVAISQAFHETLIAARLLQACSQFTSPYCFEEGPDYPGGITTDGYLLQGDGSDDVALADGYAGHNWVTDNSSPLTVRVENTGGSGSLLVSVACFKAGTEASPASISVTSAAAPVTSGESTVVTSTHDSCSDTYAFVTSERSAQAPGNILFYSIEVVATPAS